MCTTASSIYENGGSKYSLGEYFTRQLVSQLDIAPSIAALFNAEFPENRYVAITVLPS